jgi:ankyrin repeat protein
VEYSTSTAIAARYNRRENVEILLDYGADEFILNNNKSFYNYLNDENKEYFTQNYPTSVYNAISHNYKKSFTEFIKDYNIKK